MPIEVIEPRRLYREVADQLRRLIDGGEFAVGNRLPTERELALQLGVSRPTVREALIALEVEGRIRIRVGSGIYVLATSSSLPLPLPTPPVAGPFEVLTARALFEGAVAEAAARQATVRDLAAIDATLVEMRRATNSTTASVAADRAFHLAIAAILSNEAVTRVVGDLFDQRINPYFARLASYFESPTSWREALGEHEAIRDSVAAGDATAACLSMRRHLECSQERFSRTFGEAQAGLASGRTATEIAATVRPSPRAKPRAVAANTRRK